MNREIKFRAWDKALNKWIYLIIDNSKRGAVYFTGIDKNIVVGGAVGRRIGNWLEFTGLYDKHGTEIYEGDIVKYANQTSYIAWDNENAKFVNVEIEIAEEFGIDESQPAKDQSKMEVIGNIYENPEMLEVSDARN